jgi:uncharacterized protein (DUF58 family)
MANSVVLERFPASVESHSSTPGNPPQRQRVYIFLTRYGLIFSFNLLVMLLGAVNYNNSLAYALTFLLGGLFMVSMLHTYSNLRGLIINASPADPVFAGQQACFPLLLDNRLGPFRLAIDLQTKPKVKKRLKRKSVTTAMISVNIAKHSLQAAQFHLDTHKRGYLVPGRIKITSTWPLGLFRAWSYMHIDHRCIVYPRPEGSTSLPQQTMLDEEEQAGNGSGTEDFIGFRQYRAGDSMRAVDWKAYARERGLLSKRFSGKGSRKILIDWQHSSHLDGVEQRLSQLCLWIIEAEKQGVQYALALSGVSDFDFANGESHKHRCLHALATYGLNENEP